jgi:hypothetical protein
MNSGLLVECVSPFKCPKSKRPSRLTILQQCLRLDHVWYFRMVFLCQLQLIMVPVIITHESYSRMTRLELSSECKRSQLLEILSGIVRLL